MRTKLLIYLKRIIAVTCVCSMFAIIWKTLHYMIIDDRSSFTRIMMHEYYNQNNIDILFAAHHYVINLLTSKYWIIDWE